MFETVGRSPSHSAFVIVFVALVMLRRRFLFTTFDAFSAHKGENCIPAGAQPVSLSFGRGSELHATGENSIIEGTESAPSPPRAGLPV